LEAAHGLAEPVIMDATVEQGGDYRFIYLLPLGPDRLLVEDTRYSDSPDLAHAPSAEAIGAYVADRGWAIAEVLREESGVLPITLAGDPEAFWDEKPGLVPRSGLRAGLFHPTTGYSLPEAVRLAELVAGTRPLSSSHLFARVRDHAMGRWRDQGFFRLLNRLLFDAAEGDARYRVLERFYRLPEPLIRRFYAGHPILFDKARLLAGKPPVPLAAAFGCLSERAFLRRPDRDIAAETA
jgi:lycopene beta-cyclase